MSDASTVTAGPAPATPKARAATKSPRAAAQPVVKTSPKAATKAPAKAPTKVVTPRAKVGTKAPAKTSARTSTKTPVKAAPKPVAKESVKAATTKAAKIKLMRDSFTMPSDEYAAFGTLKQRALLAAHPVKKSELLRAGIKLLVGLSDAALLRALKSVPAIKTGRPKAKKGE